MRRLIYSMNVSVDGYIAAPGNEIDWSVPDEELHQFHNDRTRELGAHLLGRRLYETMVYWETADRNPEAGAVELDFARVWKRLPKVVFSTTLERVEGNTTLATEGPAEELAKLRAQPGGDIGVGGAGLASAFIEQNLVDEYRVFVTPVILGGGTPFFPKHDRRIGLDLLETKAFGGSKVTYLRYART